VGVANCAVLSSTVQPKSNHHSDDCGECTVVAIPLVSQHHLPRPASKNSKRTQRVDIGDVVPSCRARESSYTRAREDNYSSTQSSRFFFHQFQTFTQFIVILFGMIQLILIARCFFLDLVEDRCSMALRVEANEHHHCGQEVSSSLIDMANACND
jgi:hypothetical protein